MKKKSKYLIYIIAPSILVLLLALNYLMSDNLGPKHSDITKKIERLTMAIGMEPLNSLTIIAEEKGFFFDEGLDIEFKEYPSGKRALNQGMVSGNADIATSACTPIVFKSFKDRDFSIIATIGSSNNEIRIVARRDRGILEPIEKSEIDAFSMREPYVSESLRLIGDNAIVFSEPDLFIKKYHIVVHNTFIKNRPEVIKSILRALVRAERFVNNNFNESVSIVSKKLNVEQEKIRKILLQMDLSVSLDQTIINIFENVAKWAIKYRMVNGSELPNYLDYIYIAGIDEIVPDAVTIIH